MGEEICEYEHCENVAEFLDREDNRVCEQHMVQEVEDVGNDVTYEDFESLTAFYSAIEKTNKIK